MDDDPQLNGCPMYCQPLEKSCRNCFQHQKWSLSGFLEFNDESRRVLFNIFHSDMISVLKMGELQKQHGFNTTFLSNDLDDLNMESYLMFSGGSTAVHPCSHVQLLTLQGKRLSSCPFLVVLEWDKRWGTTSDKVKLWETDVEVGKACCPSTSNVAMFQSHRRKSCAVPSQAAHPQLRRVYTCLYICSAW